MRVAIVHDYIKEYGGAERVLEALHEIWPSSPVFTTVYLPKFLGPHKERFKGWDIRTSFLQHVPFKEKLISPFRVIVPFVFKSFDFSKYDVVIVSATGAYSPNTIKIRNPKSETRNKSQNTKYKIQNTIRVCYCHTPPRYLYGYATARDWKKNIMFRVLGEMANHFLRLVDFRSSQNVDYFITNSLNVKKRIDKFYRRDSTVIYPPASIDGRRWKMEDGNLKMEDGSLILSNKEYFLAGGRIAKPKHIDLIVETFKKLKLPLKVFGRTFVGHNSSLATHNSSIDLVGEVSDEEKLDLMRNAKAYIFASEDEDFGITPVEAMSVGTPVIAYKSGGVEESVLQSRTGLFFNELTVESLTKAIKQFDKMRINPTDCINQAHKFSKERFKKEIREFVEGKMRR